MKIGQLDIRLPKASPVSKAPRSRKIALIVVACVALLIWAKPMGLLLWARIRILTSIPKTAIAEPTASQPAKPVQPTEIDPKLPGIGADLRDPFAVDGRVFPLPGPAHADPKSHQAPDAEAVAERPTEEPVAAAPSAEIVRAARIESLRVSAESLRVNSAGAGLQVAVIEGKVVRVGETISAADGTTFTLAGVLDAAVVLGAEGREFTVRMPVLPESKAIRPAPRGGGGKP